MPWRRRYLLPCRVGVVGALTAVGLVVTALGARGRIRTIVIDDARLALLVGSRRKVLERVDLADIRDVLAAGATPRVQSVLLVLTDGRVVRALARMNEKEAHAVCDARSIRRSDRFDAGSAGRQKVHEGCLRLHREIEQILGFGDQQPRSLRAPPDSAGRGTNGSVRAPGPTDPGELRVAPCQRERRRRARNLVRRWCSPRVARSPTPLPS